jgi:hypothetical protein
MTPRFSVVVPLYNRATLISDCLGPLLQPAARGIEVVVVDDGSTDGSGAVVEQLAAASQGAEVRLVRQANAGASAARNRGVSEVSSEWIALLDSDDVWLPWAIPMIEAAMAAAGSASLIFWRTETFRDPATLPTEPSGPAELAKASSYLDFCARRMLPIYGSCNVAVRRRHFLEVGGFDGAIRSAEDQDLFLRLSGLGEVLAVVAPVMMGGRNGQDGKLSQNFKAVADGLIRIHSKRADGAYAGAAEQLDMQMANMGSVAFWRMLHAGDRQSARRVLSAYGGLVRRVFGIRYALLMWIALLRPGTSGSAGLTSASGGAL